MAIVQPAVKIRVEAGCGKAEDLAGEVVKLLEILGFEVIEWSRGIELRDDPNRERSYVSANPKRIELGDQRHGS